MGEQIYLKPENQNRIEKVCRLAKIRIREVKSGNKTERIPTVEFNEEALEQMERLEEYEADYKNLVSGCRALLQQAKKDRVSTYWRIAEKIIAFRGKYEVTGFMETLHLDLGISIRTLGYLLQFRQEYGIFDKNISWAYYLELLTHLPKSHRKEFQKRISAGKIKSRDDLRSQIANYRKENRISFGQHNITHDSSQ